MLVSRLSVTSTLAESHSAKKEPSEQPQKSATRLQNAVKSQVQIKKSARRAITACLKAEYKNDFIAH